MRKFIIFSLMAMALMLCSCKESVIKKDTIITYDAEVLLGEIVPTEVWYTEVVECDRNGWETRYVRHSENGSFDYERKVRYKGKSLADVFIYNNDDYLDTPIIKKIHFGKDGVFADTNGETELLTNEEISLFKTDFEKQYQESDYIKVSDDIYKSYKTYWRVMETDSKNNWTKLVTDKLWGDERRYQVIIRKIEYW